MEHYWDHTIFVGYTTVPIEIGTIDFFNNEIKSELFERYRENLSHYGGEKENLEDYYRPFGYRLFGLLDLLVLSKVDDTNFASNVFKANHVFKNNDDQVQPHFDYQVSTGYLAKSVPSNGRATDIFISPDKRFPFIAVTNIKINSSLLSGCGKSVIKLVSWYLSSTCNNIELICSDEPKTNLHYEFILLESFSSDELILVSFSNSYQLIAEKILILRELRLETLISEIGDNYEVKTKVDDILDNSILNTWMEGDSKRNEKILNCHPITSTNTLYGYDILYKNKDSEEFFYGINEEESIDFVTHYDVKPGHLKDFFSLFGNKNVLSEDMKLSIPLGRGTISKRQRIDSSYIFENDLLTIADKGLVSILTENHENTDIEEKNFSKCLNKQITFNKVNIPFRDEGKNFDDKILQGFSTHFSVSKKLLKFAFKNEDFVEIHSNLKKLRVSKVLQSRIMKMYNNFNDAILDKQMYLSFISLKPYLNYIRDELKKQVVLNPDKSEEVHKLVSSMVDSFEKAHKNRISHSHRTINQTDTNLDYSGGHHQFIIMIDTIYKKLLSYIDNGKLRHEIVYISGFSGTDVNRFEMRIHYLHIQVIQLFFTVIIKEVTNSYIKNKRDVTNTKRINGDISNIKIDSFYEITDVSENGYQNILEFREIFHDELEELNKDFRSDENHNELFSSVSNEFFNYLLADLCLYHYGFIGDVEMFCYWMLNQICQNAQYYKGERLNQNYLLRVLLRLSVICITQDKVSSLKKYFEYLCDQGVVEDCSTIDSVIEFSNKLVENELFSNWYDIATLHSFDVFKVLKDFTDDKHSQIYKDFSKSKEFYQYYFAHNNFCDHIQDKVPGIKEKIRDGSVIYYDKDENGLIYLMSLFYSYLSVIKERNNDRIVLVKRDSEGKPIVQAEKYIYTDCLGGVFINDHNMRKQIFLSKASVMNSLWDFSIKNTRSLFD